MINRRIATAAIGGAFASSGWLARAQTPPFPSKVISIKVGYPAGGAADAIARVLQPHLQRLWGQAVIVENLPGAGGSIGVQKALSAAADGHTIYVGTASDVVLAPLTVPSARYKPEELRLLSCVGVSDFVLVTRPGLSFSTLDDLIAHSRNPANKELSYASFGNGSIFHLVAEDLSARIGGKMLHVPFTGMGTTITNLIGNQVDMAFLPVAGQTVALIKDGRLKPVAVTGLKRNAQLPSVQTVDESRSLTGFDHNVWLGVFSPVALPNEIAGKINASVNEAIRSPDYIKFSAENGTAIPDPGMSLAQASAFYAQETGKLRRLAQGIKLETK